MLAGTPWIHTVTWSPDGLRLAATTELERIRIWDASIADRYLKSHGELRAKASALQVGLKHLEAIDLLERLRKLHPEEGDLEARIRQLRWNDAVWLAVNGQVDKAAMLFQELNTQSPDLPDDRLVLPGMLLRMRRASQAIEMLEKAVAEFPQRAEYHEELAFAYECRAIQLCQSGEVPNAVPILRKLAQEFPERPGHRSELVRQLTEQLAHGKGHRGLPETDAGIP